MHESINFEIIRHSSSRMVGVTTCMVRGMPSDFAGLSAWAY